MKKLILLSLGLCFAAMVQAQTLYSISIYLSSAGTLSSKLQTYHNLSTVNSLYITGSMDARDIVTLTSSLQMYAPLVKSVNLSGANIVAYTGIDGTVKGRNVVYNANTIPDSAFFNSTIDSIVIPSNVTIIDRYAFNNCFLSSFTIPASVTTINDFAFINSNVTITLASGNNNFTVTNGVLFNNTQTCLIYCPFNKSGTYTIPTTVTNISGGAFNSSRFDPINIPTSVTSIGANAFAACNNVNVDINNSKYSSINGVLFDKAQTSLIHYPSYNIGSYTIPSSVKYIADYAFAGGEVTSITIPTSVLTIGNYTFEYCTNLNSINLPSSIISIGDFAFYHCDVLTSINIPPLVTKIGTDVFAYSGITKCFISSSVKSIGDEAFYFCSNLDSITIPSSDTTIGKWAFYYCGSLKYVSIPLSITSISDFAFSSTGLTSVTIPSSVTTIGDRAFFYCNDLKTVVIPSSITDIADRSFSSCNSLSWL
jgi:hypothetical protein